MSVDHVSAPGSAACQRYLEALRAGFGDSVLGSEQTPTDLVVRVEASVWAEVAAVCRKEGLSSFCFLSGLDWLDSPIQTSRYENVWETAAADTAAADTAAADTVGEDPATESVPKGYQSGVAGGDSRFQVFVRFTSPTDHCGVVVKADLDETDPHVASITGVFAGANWHEREAWEMFGFRFDGHPNLSHIYLPGAFEGYPLRKDFPLLARELKPWPGLTNVEPIAGEAEEGEP